VLQQLARSIDPTTVHGRLIIIPTLSMEASAACVREWPEDGTNFNRVMPGRFDGSRAAQLALFVSSVLMPAADIVFDLHTGGHNMRIQPSTMFFAPTDNAMHKEEVAAHLAMLSPLLMLKRLPPVQPPGTGTVWYQQNSSYIRL
jgi:predicted deacylase